MKQKAENSEINRIPHFTSQGYLKPSISNILFLPKYPRMGASSRLRTYQFLSLWRDAGVDRRVSPFFNEQYLNEIYTRRKPSILNLLGCYCRRMMILFTVKRYDFVWVEKELFPFTPAWMERLLSSLGVKLVLDYDDATFHNYDRSSRSWVRRLLPRKIDRVMQASHLVLAGNEYLASRARAAGAKRVALLPTVIDPERYVRKPFRIPLELQLKASLNTGDDLFSGSKTKRPTIGWIGSPSTIKYLSMVSDALCELYRLKSFRFILINAGSVRYQEFLHLPEDNVQHLVWSEEEEITQLSKIDIGIMPLPDNPWERGKCAYKLIQYMACGIPVVASPVGMNREVVIHGKNGYLAESGQEWVKYLGDLLNSPELREEMGWEGRALVEGEYTLSRNFEKLRRALLEV